MFAGRTVLITGAAGGIGRAMTRAFAGRGARCVLVDRDADRLADLARTVDGAVPMAVDLRPPGAAARCIAQTVEACDRLDVVVANAGTTVFARFEDLRAEEVHAMLDVNLRAAVELVHAALPHMGPGGHVVLTSSMAGFVGFPLQTVYSASKFGLAGFGDALRIELAPRGIGVTTLLPGTVATEFLDRAGSRDPETSRTLGRWMRRAGTPPERVARAAISGIRRNRRRIYVGWDAKIVRVVDGILPFALPFVLRRLTRWYLGRRPR